MRKNYVLDLTKRRFTWNHAQSYQGRYLRSYWYRRYGIEPYSV